MVIVVMRLNALPEKSLEIKQTLLALTRSTRKETGCLSHHVFEDLENENTLGLIEMWKSHKELDEHWQSDHFSVLLVTRSLLNRPPEMMITEVSRSSGWETVEAARRNAVG
jgi:quinol monooxygenase YgiN